MWNKNESTTKATDSPGAGARPATRPPAPPSPAAAPAARPATIGSSISIKGDISGKEDLVIEGRVEGAVELGEYNVTVGNSGKVAADIHGKRICIEGEVTGDLFGDEIVIRESGQVIGNARAPRGMLDNGCHFRGNIDMKPADGSVKPTSRAGRTV